MALKSLDELVSKAHKQTGLDQSTIEGWCDEYQYNGYSVVDRYWIELPFVFAEIHYNEEYDSYQYVIHQPDLESELTTQMDVIADLMDISTEAIENASHPDLASAVHSIACVTSRIDTLSLVEAYSIGYLLKNEKSPLDGIRGIVADSNISSIDCSGKQAKLRVYNYKYGHIPSNIALSTAEMRSYIDQVRDETDSLERGGVSVNLDDKTRFFANDEDSCGTISFSIQTYDRGNISPIELIQSNIFDPYAMGYLWEIMSYGANVVISGGTQAGKSVTLNAIGNFIPMNQRVVSVEPQREIELDHPYWTPMSSDDETPIEEVVEKSLRIHPDYVLFDEMRGGDETRLLFEAAMTGHSTALTMHAGSVEDSLTRLSAPPIDVPSSHLSTIDVMISLAEYVQDGSSINRCSKIVEPGENLNGSIDALQSLLIGEWDSQTYEHTVQPSESALLDEIAESRLTTNETVLQHIDFRGEILSYMAKQKLDSVSDITAVVTQYSSDPEILSTIDSIGVEKWVTQNISE